MSAPTRRVVTGLAVLVAYAVVALVVSGPPVRPMFDVGGPPAPYRWANPPPEFAPTNQPPSSATHTLALGPGGSDAASISTSDGQASVIFREGTFPARSGETAVIVKIDPLDPATIGTPPPGLRYDGNAYRYLAAYKKSDVEATPTQAATIVLEFPLVATKLLRRDGTAWTDLKANPVNVSQQIFSTSSKLGVFVAGGPPLNAKLPGQKKFPAALVISLSAAFAAVVAGLVARLRARKRRAAKPPAKKAPGARPKR